ncbi:MAG TPA: CBS domain-containing protein [Nitrospiria bacterium]
MSRDLCVVSRKSNITEVSDLFKRNGIGSLLVKEKNQFIGIITETDIVHKVVANGLSPQSTRVDSVMSYPLVGIDPESSAEQAAGKMLENGVRHLAVIQGEEVVGMVSMRDLMKTIFNRRDGAGS